MTTISTRRFSGRSFRLRLVLMGREGPYPTVSMRPALMPLLTKYRFTALTLASWWYTDILLLKAECILRGAAGGTQKEADAIVSQVLARAGLPAISTVTLPQLFQERRLEFVGEGLRWHDLVRSGQVEAIMPAWIRAEDIQKQMQPFQKNFIIYPVPQAEIDSQTGLYAQNKGY